MRLVMCLIITIVLASPVFAADEKIDPQTYICAEFVASSIDGTPPLFEGLQIDGYACGQTGHNVSDANTFRDMLLAVSDSCSSKPTEKALAHWKEMRKNIPAADEGFWRADKITCGDYNDNPDDGSGFVIWLDGFNRGKTGKSTSIFTDQATLDHFLEVCRKSPERLMIDVIAENAK